MTPDELKKSAKRRVSGYGGYNSPTGTKATTGYVTPGPSSHGGYGRPGNETSKRYQPTAKALSERGPSRSNLPPTSRGGERDYGAWKGKRRPIPENRGKAPQGGVDYGPRSDRNRAKGGVWRDSSGRVIATAKAEDAGSRSRNNPRNRSRSRRVV